jgi:adenylate kinase
VAQTKPLIEYYNSWAQHGDTNGLKAPEYRRISGAGTVDEIRARVFDALK